MVIINMEKKKTPKLVPYQEQSTSTETNIRSTIKMTDQHCFLFREDFWEIEPLNYLIILQVRVHYEAAKNKIMCYDNIQ